MALNPSDSSSLEHLALKELSLLPMYALRTSVSSVNNKVVNDRRRAGKKHLGNLDEKIYTSNTFNKSNVLIN